jgi:hypothetical protein
LLEAVKVKNSDDCDETRDAFRHGCWEVQFREQGEGIRGAGHPAAEQMAKKANARASRSVREKTLV